MCEKTEKGLKHNEGNRNSGKDFLTNGKLDTIAKKEVGWEKDRDSFWNFNFFQSATEDDDDTWFKFLTRIAIPVIATLFWILVGVCIGFIALIGHNMWLHGQLTAYRALTARENQAPTFHQRFLRWLQRWCTCCRENASIEQPEAPDRAAADPEAPAQAAADPEAPAQAAADPEAPATADQHPKELPSPLRPEQLPPPRPEQPSAPPSRPEPPSAPPSRPEPPSASRPDIRPEQPRQEKPAQAQGPHQDQRAAMPPSAQPAHPDQDPNDAFMPRRTLMSHFPMPQNNESQDTKAWMNEMARMLCQIQRMSVQKRASWDSLYENTGGESMMGHHDQPTGWQYRPAPPLPRKPRQPSMGSRELPPIPPPLARSSSVPRKAKKAKKTETLPPSNRELAFPLKFMGKYQIDSSSDDDYYE